MWWMAVTVTEKHVELAEDHAHTAAARRRRGHPPEKITYRDGRLIYGLFDFAIGNTLVAARSEFHRHGPGTWRRRVCA